MGNVSEVHAAGWARFFLLPGRLTTVFNAKGPCCKKPGFLIQSLSRSL